MSPDELEVTVVIPCLNEARTVAACVREAVIALAGAAISGEVIVSDNGSTDGSPRLAETAGARIVPVAVRGYGHALMAGIAAARGRFIIMGDADGSYDFGETPRLVAQLRKGFDLVQGCRLSAGGGRVADGAMPWLHRWIGNPLLSWLAKAMFGTKLHDVYCGLRGFTRDAYDRLDLRCTGMEFATEMIINAALRGLRTTEVAITLRRDGRGGVPSHLRTFRDGWRTLRLFLLLSPRWVYLFPSTALLVFGAAGYLLALPGARLGSATLGVHTLLVASTCLLLGEQGIFFGLFTATFAVRANLLPASPSLLRFYRHFTLERGLLVSAAAALGGIGLIGMILWQWWQHGFGPLDYATTMRWVIPGVTLIALAAQAIFGSFVITLVSLDRR
jgi:hypothetical protein